MTLRTIRLSDLQEATARATQEAIARELHRDRKLHKAQLAKAAAEQALADQKARWTRRQLEAIALATVTKSFEQRRAQARDKLLTRMGAGAMRR